MGTHFFATPCGWPRDAIDAALIGLFGAGSLRAVVNGVALRPPQLDQAKVPNTDFRVESATIDTRQRLKPRKFFQIAGIDCKPNGNCLTGSGMVPSWWAEEAGTCSCEASRRLRRLARIGTECNEMSDDQHPGAPSRWVAVVRPGFGDFRVLNRIDSERVMTRYPRLGGVDRDE